MPITDPKPTSDNPQTQAPQNVQYADPYPQQFEDGTIDLYKLWITMWNKKWLVIAVTVIAVLGSVVYALLQTPIYKAEALLLPPKAKDVKSVNVQLENGLVMKGEQTMQLRRVQGVTVDLAFAAFKNNLSSRSLQKKFIDEQALMDILAPNQTSETRVEDIYEGFTGLIELGDYCKRKHFCFNGVG